MNEKKRTPVFPFTVYCDRERGWPSWHFRELYQKTRDPDVTWYGFDVIVHSRVKVEFITYDMKDSVYGGLGKEIHRHTVDVDREVTEKPILQRIGELAEERERQDEEWQRQQRLDRHFAIIQAEMQEASRRS